MPGVKHVVLAAILLISSSYFLQHAGALTTDPSEGAELEKEYPHLYWTPCAAHCINLMLKDIGKLPFVKLTLSRAMELTGFIYSHAWVLKLMRGQTNGKELLRLAVTRFATSFMTLSSIHRQKNNLRKMFNLEKWRQSKWARDSKGKSAERIVHMPSFWNNIVRILKLTAPLVSVLKLVDGDKKPAMGYIYEAMDRSKEVIAKAFGDDSTKYAEVFDIIDKRWQDQLHRPLHAAGYYLNPAFFYDHPNIQGDDEVMKGLYQVIKKIVPTQDQDKTDRQLDIYRHAGGLFGMEIAKRNRKKKSPVEALRLIKNNLVDPMKKLNSWNNGDPCTSNWTGIFCTAVQNDGYLHIQEILLLNSNLSGILIPQFGLLSHLKILDFMWNNISGSIPREIGNITSLKLVLLNGNQLSGSLPDEIGNLINLDRLQIDQNHIAGAIPKSFSNMSKVKHLHMNNNSISGQLPPELSRLPRLLHLLVDNNNLSGHLPPEFSSMPTLKILQLDNNNFRGNIIPASYGNMSTLRKLSLRNCSLQGVIPNFSGIPQLTYLDLSWNHLKGSIPSNRLSTNITTIDLSRNSLDGFIPSSFTGLPKLQRLFLGNNFLIGSVPNIWENLTFSWNESLILDFQNNLLSNITTPFNPPANVTILVYGNPLCNNANQMNLLDSCQPQIINPASGSVTNSKISCSPCPTDQDYEYNPLSPIPCLCAVPLGVGLRLKSPSISDFHPYIDDFRVDMTSLLDLHHYQLYFSLYTWEKGPRLRMYLKLYPSNSSLFNASEVLRLQQKFTGWEITLSDTFGPYELLNFTLGFYVNEIPGATASWLSKGAFAGILLGSLAGAFILSATAIGVIMRKRSRYRALSKQSMSKLSIKIDDVKCFKLEEMASATKNFCNSMEVGRGGYGKVYKGILADGTLVAIKRAQVGSLQGSKEFLTEIELLSRLHHRNLVSLVGYCDEDDEQMLVYEFMQNGTLRDHLSSKAKEPPSFPMRLHIALETSRGILYLHTEADPPIFHRDIKASNILLDARFVAKVADFGLSRLAPVENVEGFVPAHVSTVVKGTPGYLDPEYFLTHKLTDKSDVYSLGVVFLELLTGMLPICHGKNIVREVNKAHHSGQILSIIDSRMGAYPSECTQKFVLLALRCCQDQTDERPSMLEVVRELECIWSLMLEIDSMTLVSMETEPSKLEGQSSSSSLMGAYIIDHPSSVIASITPP